MKQSNFLSATQPGHFSVAINTYDGKGKIGGNFIIVGTFCALLLVAAVDSFVASCGTVSLLYQKRLGKGVTLMVPVWPRLDPVAYYDHLATDFALRCDAVTFEAVHPNLAKHLPSNGRILGVGSGSGRDARGLAARGLHLTAVEPSAAFRLLGGESSFDGVTWIDDRLHMLALLDSVVEPFDLSFARPC